MHAVIVGICLGFLVLGLLLFTRMFMLGYDSREWPSVDGTVESIQMITDKSDDSPAYSAFVTYRFKVGRREYVSHRIRALNWLGNTPAAARRDMDAYPPGARVTVWYRPGKPDDAVLEPGLGLAEMVFLPAYVLVCLAVAYEFAMALRGGA
ncbi:MAG: DUF3592 domain-containing protein [Pseudomonadota bacterium]